MKAFIKSDEYIKEFYSLLSKFTKENQDNDLGGTKKGEKYSRNIQYLHHDGGKYWNSNSGS